MQNRLSKLLVTTLIATLGLMSATLLHAQAWPNKTIKLVVPFPPGGSTDAIGRQLAQELTKSLGQPVIIENKGGANGNIGADFVAKAAPDGYTFLVSGVGSNAINYSLYRSMPFADKDFAHVSLLATGPNVLVVNPEFPATASAPVKSCSATTQNPVLTWIPQSAAASA